MDKTQPEQLPSKALPVTPDSIDPLYGRIHAILMAARTNVARSVNTEMVRAYWLIGREIVEEEQAGQTRAAYGEDLIGQTSSRLQGAFGKGFTPTNVKYVRLFYLAYPQLLDDQIRHTACDEFRSGRSNTNLSWSHCRLLTRIDSPHARAFYEIEAVQNHWSVRELERQISSLLFERLALSRDKPGLMELATQGQEVQTPEDAIKDPVVLEFLGLPESPRLVESDLEEALVSNLQAFPLELGKGFALTKLLRCRTQGDNATIGLILCADRNEAVVRYTLGEANAQIFASRYKLHLPSEQELADEIRRELRQVRPGELQEGDKP